MDAYFLKIWRSYHIFDTQVSRFPWQLEPTSFRCAIYSKHRLLLDYIKALSLLTQNSTHLCAVFLISLVWQCGWSLCSRRRIDAAVRKRDWAAHGGFRSPELKSDMGHNSCGDTRSLSVPSNKVGLIKIIKTPLWYCGVNETDLSICLR